MCLSTSSAVTPSAPSSPLALITHGIADPQREKVELFIRGVFKSRYGANVQSFAPLLVSLQSQGEIVAAAGYRSAAAAPLFLERYLFLPVEAAITSRSASFVRRRDIVEVGHLAAARAGEGRRLIPMIGAHLAQQGFSWAVSTLTFELHQLFRRLSIESVMLGSADPSALGSDAAHWGSYYDHRPMVFAASLRQAPPRRVLM